MLMITHWARINWPRYFYTGALIVFATWAATCLSGCRFGNHEVDQASTDPLSGYYETQAQSLTFCAVNASLHETCQKASASDVPSEISNIMTNPVGLKVVDYNTGSAEFVAVDSTGAVINSSLVLPTTVGAGPQYLLGLSGDIAPQTLFQDPACTLNIHLDEDGQVQVGGATTLNLTLKRAGRVAVKYTLTETFTGTCGPSLQAMYSCYNNVNSCGGTSAGQNQQLQALVNSTFAAYIQAGAMAATDIPNISKLSYEASYQ